MKYYVLCSSFSSASSKKQPESFLHLRQHSADELELAIPLPSSSCSTISATECMNEKTTESTLDEYELQSGIMNPPRKR